jgi:hypothetical protein
MFIASISYFYGFEIFLCLSLSLGGKKVALQSARHAIHLQFNISANALEIRAVQSQKFGVLLTGR